MIDIPAEWELAKAMPAGGCSKCGQCSGQGAQCAAKPGPAPTPEQDAFIRSISTPVTLDELRRRGLA